MLPSGDNPQGRLHQTFWFRLRRLRLSCAGLVAGANRRTAKLPSIPDITRMIARIEDWKEGHGKARGRAETDRVLGETHRLFDEISNMLTEMRRPLLGSGRQR
jgi:hypothetical protein